MIVSEGAEWVLSREGSSETAQRFHDRRQALRAGMTLAHQAGAGLLLNPVRGGTRRAGGRNAAAR